MDKRIKVLSLKELLESEPELPEHAYRRGYFDGFRIAFDCYFDLLDAGLSKGSAYKRCLDFWERKLDAWANGDCTHGAFPPELSVDK